MIAPNLPSYTPSPERAARTRLSQLITVLQDDGVMPSDIVDAHGFQRWSVENLEAFWAAIWRTAGIVADGPGSPRAPWTDVLLGGHRMAPPVPGDGPTWFTDTRLNYAEHLLQRRDGGIAVSAWNEHGRHTQVTFAALSQRVAQLQAALVAAGVRSGDRVAGWMPNIPDAVAMMLATSSIGAVWSSCSPDFGTQAVLDRFAQIAPRILIAASGYQYNGKRIDCIPRLADIVAGLPSVEQTWLVPYNETTTDLATISNARIVDDVVEPFRELTSPTFERLPFDHPLYILYSSGTTGLPKCIVHGAGGTLLQHWKELALHTDVSSEDRVFYYTTCGWMMWNWLVSSLALGSTIVLYDGAPLSPDASVLWRMAEKERVTVFGTSARYLATCEKEKLEPGSAHDLSALRCILSTGSPLAARAYDYVYRAIKSDVHLASISGGTDIVSCFALGDPTGSVYRGELQMRGLGMAVDVFDEHGRPVRGIPGELVCTKPFPSMPVAFWNDPDGSRYRSAYFEHFPGVWRHGDWAEITAHDGVVIHGRSDSTLNPGGVRIGTAEIYRQVEQFAEILESVVIEHQRANSLADSRIVLFVRMRDGATLDDTLRRRIQSAIRDNTSPRHVPRQILQVPDIPRTVSGKISEIAVRDAVHGRHVANADALANPGILALYHGILKD